jgi:plasmid stabilization system protein ParE
VKVVWSLAALRQLEAIHAFVAQHSPQYATRILERLLERAESLERFPLLGARAYEFDDEGVRELLETPYRLLYEVTGDRVEVLAVVHSARDYRTITDH